MKIAKKLKRSVAGSLKVKELNPTPFMLQREDSRVNLVTQDPSSSIIHIKFDEDSGIDKKESVNFIPIDPSNYIFLKRKYNTVKDKYHNNAENILNKEDPIIPISFDETLFETEVVDFATKAFDKKEKLKMNIDELLNNDEMEPEIDALEVGKFSQLLQELEEDITNEESYNLYSGYMDKVLILNDNKKYIGEEMTFYNLALTSNMGNSFLAAPTEGFCRIALASNLQVESILKATMKLYNDCIKDLADYDRNNQEVVIQDPKELINFYFYNALLDFRAEYLLSLALEATMSIKSKDFNIFASSLLAEVIEDKVEKFEFGDFKKFTEIYSLSTEHEVETIAERHGYLDAILGGRFWESQFITNQFPYVSLDESVISEEYSELARLNFFKGWKKGKVVINKLDEKYYELKKRVIK